MSTKRGGTPDPPVGSVKRATRFESSGALRGTVVPPPDKSISHRAALLAAMADGTSRIAGYLDSADTRSTLAAVAALGAEVCEVGSDEHGGIDVTVAGIGLRGPGSRTGAGKAHVVDVGNAGTLLRLLPGWLAGQEQGTWSLDGDESIRRRPVDRIAEPLRRMGANVECRDGRLTPLVVTGSPLTGVPHRMTVASAQVKSCLLLAGLLADGATEVVEPTPSRDHTERMLRAAGAKIKASVAGTDIAVRGSLPARRATVEPAESLRSVEWGVPGDFSSAAFLIGAAVLIPGSSIRIEGVGLNPTRVGLLGVLNRMGALIEVEEGPPAAGEPRGAITARYSKLAGVRVAPGEVPVTIDELPLVGLLGCFAEGETVVSGAEELRHKESDRIAGVIDGLRALGAEAEATKDGFAVRGAGALSGGTIDSRGDHRMAMIGAIAGLASEGGVEVDGMAAAAISYPGFESDLRSLLK